MGSLLLNTASGLSSLGGALVQNLGLSAVDWLTAEDYHGPRQTELALQTSTEGAPIPIVYGRMRVTGQVIWAARFNERAQTRSRSGAKGGGEETNYTYSVSFAVALCEGPISGLGKVWANGTLLDLSTVMYRVHLGAEDQAADPLMEAIEGLEHVPAYQGLAYIVFEDFPLDPYGQRIPNLSFEVLSAARTDGAGQHMEDLIRGVCLIPASGEFAYSETEVARELSLGREVSENRHTFRAASDLVAALDDLEARLPHCRSVALVTSWFGNDLRCGECEIKPGVETRDKTTRPMTWHSAGLNRATAHLVSQIENGPAYGGTPSDETITSTIRLLKSRGYAVTLYPFILMDVPQGNELPDPYGLTEQAVYPWRGRITCFPAADQATTVDQTPAAGSQVDAFFGQVRASDFSVSSDKVVCAGPSDWRFNRFILHHAALAAAAGGVESIIIGSEMRGLTQIRQSQSDYPAVDHLRSLASEVRQIVGEDTKVSYAADWSEYSGHAPSDAPGDRYFHLDPLWGSDDID